MMIQHRNGIKTKSLTDSEKNYLMDNANKYSCVVLAQRVGISRHLVQKFITEQGLEIKIRKPRKRERQYAESGFFDPYAQDWY